LGANHWWLGKPWINHVDDYELSYDACFKADKEFAAQVLRAIDLAFLQLFDSCFRAATIIDIDFSETRLSNLREDILGNHFQANKPVYLITSNKKTRDQDVHISMILVLSHATSGMSGVSVMRSVSERILLKIDPLSHRSAYNTWLRDDCVSVSKVNRQIYPYPSCANSSVLQKSQVIFNKSDIVKLPTVLKKPVAGLPSPSHWVNIPCKLQIASPHLCQNSSISIEENLPSQ